jgi:transcriptional regulator with AAA-type ATPase domain
MSSETREESTEAVSDEQRLDVLEKGQKLDRIILLALAAVLVVILASWLTSGLMSMLSEDEASVSASQVEAMQAKTLALEQQVVELQQQLSEQSALLTALQNRPAAEPGQMNSGDNSALTKQLTETLIGQEQSFQQSLSALKAGMRDLAGMIAGSRSWLADYNEALDKQLAASQARVKRLRPE